MNNSKKYGVVDVGSNSVRAIIYSGGKILYKKIITSQLGEGLAKTGRISDVGFERSLNAVKSLVLQLKENKVDKIYAFATEAVRSAENGNQFVKAVLDSTDIQIDVVSGEDEGELGLIGALNGADGGVIDIGGASAEIVATNEGKIVYSHSLPLGAVRLYEFCGEDFKKLESYIGERIKEYGKVPQYVDYYAIGGTATNLAFIDADIEKYDENVTHGRKLTVKKVEDLIDKISSLSLLERAEKLRIDEKRAKVIVCGAYLLKCIMKEFNIQEITVSEGDNILGYLKKKVFGEGYAK